MSYNQLTWLENKGHDNKNRKVALYRCSCGKEKILPIWFVEHDRIRSCGCLQKKRASESNTKHGMYTSTEYQIYASIKDRCYNVNNDRYEDYGGRGIGMCDRWLKSFENFYSDMGPRPSKLYSIERKNNDLGYSPDNCIWATKKQQANNTRHNKVIECNGIKMTVAQWAEEKQIPYVTLNARLQRNWTAEKALNTPVIKKIQRDVQGRYIKCQ